MAKINLVNEVLKHDDGEVIEYLVDLLSKTRMVFEKWERPEQLIGCGTTISIAHDILRGMSQRNKKKSGQEETIIL